MKLFKRKKKRVQPVIGSGEWASALAEALGEDPTGSFGIKLEVYPDAPVIVTIEKFVDENNMEIIEVIKKVAWVKDG